MKKKPTKMQSRIQLSRTVESAVIIMFVILQGNGNHFTASTGLLFFCLLLSVCYITSCLPGEGLSNTSARPTIGGNHHFHSYFKYTLDIFTCSFS